jgi:hypothetical protein
MHAAAQIEAENAELVRRARAIGILCAELAHKRDQQGQHLPGCAKDASLAQRLAAVGAEARRVSRILHKAAGGDLVKARTMLGIPPQGALLQCPPQ